MPRSSCRRRPTRACRSASCTTALSVLPSALARASASRASSAGNEMVFLTAAAMATLLRDGMKKSYHCLHPPELPGGLVVVRHVARAIETDHRVALVLRMVALLQRVARD